jgi:glyoxylase-like metal-dependent hydrolase (beta-lactamase superfamily II)
MQHIVWAGMLAALAAMVTATHAADEPAIKTIKLSDDIHVLMGAGGNIAVSTGIDGTFIIDDDMPPLAEKIQAAIQQIRNEPVRMLFNTHWHFDHTGGNEHFGRQGTLIIAHDNVRERMSTTQFSKLFNSETPPSPAAALPVVTFDNTLTLHLNGHTIKAIHIAPAHTDGDAILLFADVNIAHLGDLFFNGLYPVVDISAGGSVQGMIDGIDTILPLLDAETTVIPGHGPVSNIEGLKAFRNMLVLVHSRVKALVEDGKTVDEVLALSPSYNFDEQWAWSFMPPERWVRLVYDSVVATRAAQGTGLQPEG